MIKHFLEAGRIVNSHGVRGELVLEPWADSAEFLTQVPRFWFDEGKADAGLLACRVHKHRLLLTLKGVDSRDKADALRGKVLYLDRDDVRLEPGAWFLADLIGLRAVDENSGRVYGTLTEVLPTGANDVYRIVDEAGKEYLFPAVRHMIGRVAPEEGIITLLPIPGIFDGDYEEDKPHAD